MSRSSTLLIAAALLSGGCSSDLTLRSTPPAKSFSLPCLAPVEPGPFSYPLIEIIRSEALPLSPECPYSLHIEGSLQDHCSSGSSAQPRFLRLTLRENNLTVFRIQGEFKSTPSRQVLETLFSRLTETFPPLKK